MRQLTSIDAQFLAIEDGRTHGHVAAVGIYDPSTAPAGQLTLDAVRDLVAARLHLLPPFHWRLVEVPFGLDHPYWHHESELDLDFHIRQLALPAPGDARMLAEQVARIAARPLDRSRPLWELYLIPVSTVTGSRSSPRCTTPPSTACLCAEILSVLLDAAPEGRSLPARAATSARRDKPGQLEMLARGLAAPALATRTATRTAAPR